MKEAIDNQRVPGSTEQSWLGNLAHWLRSLANEWVAGQHHTTRQTMVGAILLVALVAFELFNYDTTEYALENLLDSVSFGDVQWATILAIAFCGIDFAGLVRVLGTRMTESHRITGSPLNPSWLLLAAWLIGGGMNALMTWWAVSLALVTHNFGNEVLTRQQLLRSVPIFVAVLVWITRILIISALSMAADGAARGPRADLIGRRSSSCTRLPHPLRGRGPSPAARTVPMHVAPAYLRAKSIHSGGRAASEKGPVRRPSSRSPEYGFAQEQSPSHPSSHGVQYL